LEKLLSKLKSEGIKPKFLYTVPTAQNPTGITMSLERRKRLLELAEEYDFLIVEDNPYGYILFEDVEVRHLKSLDKSGRVIYLSTFSKVLVPGLRLGWVVAEKEIISKMALLKQSLDLCSSTLTQFIAYEALVSGLVDRQTQILPKFYKRKRDAMLNSLEKYMPEGVEWTKPIGGMFVFVYAPKHVDTRKMLFKAINRGVAYVPGRNFFIDGSGHNTMRLNFSYPSIEDIDKGIKILADVLLEEIKRKT
ncbi:MAG TPA: PLP-dependent aminotransferase family protein, partial [Desulfurococcales archaeon]|nr:PLP-dependent aminotransferase family protein [Desulfurococcales archaeon]